MKFELEALRVANVA